MVMNIYGLTRLWEEVAMTFFVLYGHMPGGILGDHNKHSQDSWYPVQDSRQLLSMQANAVLLSN
jgi:hypothetical protein